MMKITYRQAYDKLAAEGIRMTHQRQLILTFLYEKSLSHPSAEALFDAIYAEHPKVVSRPTVYKNLHLLQSFDLLKALYIGHNPVARYDIHVLPHHHLHCLHCGSVSDYEGSLPMAHSAIPGFRAEQVYMEISGVCEACQRLQRTAAKQEEAMALAM